jgi:hypothetical protein
MSNVKVMRATDPYERNTHVFSVVASDSEVKYVFPKKRNLFDSEGQIKFALGYFGKKPKDVDSWLDIAVFNLDSFDFKPYMPLDESLESFSDYVESEQEFLNSIESNPLPSSVPTQRISSAMMNLISSDDEIADYMFEPLTSDLSEEKRKLIITTLIIAAGTQDLNPWLMPWLNGETDLDAMGFDGLVLSRPFNSQIESYDLEIDSEGETE